MWSGGCRAKPILWVHGRGDANRLEPKTDDAHHGEIVLRDDRLGGWRLRRRRGLRPVEEQQRATRMSVGIECQWKPA